MIKKKILDLIERKERLAKSKFSFAELQMIFNKTSFLLETASLSERCFCIAHDITELPHCKNCNNPVEFRVLCNGYREFCSCSCKNRYLIDNTDISQRISKTILKYHKLLPKTERRKQQDKRIKTMVERNLIADPNSLSDKIKYYNQVWRFTNEQDLKSLPNYDKRGCDFHLDHKFSIIKGFLNNIPPYIIGNIVNLEIITAHDNSSKKEKCSITKNSFLICLVQSSTTIP